MKKMPKFFVPFFCFFCFVLSCTEETKQVNVSISKNEIYTGQKVRIQTELFKNGTSVPVQPADFEYSSIKGKIAGDIYYAPDIAETDTITILHRPSKSREEINLRIIPKPDDLVAKKNDVQPAGNASIPSAKNPDDNKLQNQSVSEVIVAEIKKDLFVQEETTIHVYLNRDGERLPLEADKYTLKSVKGKIQGNIYKAPDEACQDTVSVTHLKSGQSLTVTVDVKAKVEDIPWKLEVSGIKEDLACGDQMPLVVNLYKGDKKVEYSRSDITFHAKKGKFSENIYNSPNEDCKDTITITHKPSSKAQSFKVNVKYSKYRAIHTELFTIELPSEWLVEQTDMGLRAKGGKFSDERGTECTVAVIPGLDFLDIQTLKFLCQQQKAQQKGLEETVEREIDLDGVKATLVPFENTSGDGKKAWWILAKKEKAACFLTITGNASLFESEDVLQHIIASFHVKQRPKPKYITTTISSKMQQVHPPYSSLEIPEGWNPKTFGNTLFIAMSDATYKEEPIILFIMSYQQGEVQSLDISLILVLFRQEMVKDETMKDIGEKDIKLSHGEGKLVEFEGGRDVQKRMWIVATKHDVTAYGILLLAPIELWNKNGDFAQKILDSFKPVARPKKETKD